jgi:hypothetical protein
MSVLDPECVSGRSLCSCNGCKRGPPEIRLFCYDLDRIDLPTTYIAFRFKQILKMASAYLPDALMLSILALNSSTVGVSIARQVCRAAHLEALMISGQRTHSVSAYDPDLPLWLLQQMWPGTHSFFRPKLLEAR